MQLINKVDSGDNKHHCFNYMNNAKYSHGHGYQNIVSSVHFRDRKAIESKHVYK